MSVADACATELLALVPAEHRLMADCLIRPQLGAMELEFGPDIVRAYTEGMKGAYIKFAETGDITPIVDSIAQFDPTSAELLRATVANPDSGR